MYANGQPTRVLTRPGCPFYILDYATCALGVILVRLSNTELVTTDRELKAIAKPANSGLKVIPIK